MKQGAEILEVLESLLKYADGVDYAHKGNIDKHVRSNGLHDWAKKEFMKVTGDSSSFSTDQTSVKNKQHTLEQTVSSPTTVANYRRLFVTALHIALKERPLSDFSDLIELQQKNGLKFFQGKIHEKACGEFIDILADVLRTDIQNILLSVSMFSITMDGSQPRKTGTEKELLYSKVAVRGEAIELLLECINMDDYGGDAIDLKRAIDDVILKRYSIPSEKYINLLVCCCADGASINMGKYKGKKNKIPL